MRPVHSFKGNVLVWMTPLIGVTLFILAMGAFLYSMHLEDQGQSELRTTRDLEIARQALRSRLLEGQQRLSLLTRTLEGPKQEANPFLRQARSILSDNPEISAIFYAGSNAQPVFRVDQPTTDYNLLRSTESALSNVAYNWAFNRAKESALPVFSKPFFTSEGSVHLALHSPAYYKNQFIGTSVALINLDSLLESALPQSFTQHYRVRFIDESGMQLGGTVHQTPMADSEGQKILLSPPGHNLTLQAALYHSSPLLLSNMLAWVILGLSLLIVWSFILLYRNAKMRSDAEHRLIVETEFRRAMENSVITGMRAIDFHGRITYVNPAFCNMTGYTETELQGMSPPFPYWPERSRDQQAKNLELVLKGQAPPQGLQMHMQRRDGSLFDARMYVSPLVNSKGKQTGWMTSMTDITEPLRIRQDLRAAQERFVRILEELDAAVSVEDIPEFGSPTSIFTNRLHQKWFADTAPPSTGRYRHEVIQREPFEWLNPITLRWYEVRRRPIAWVDGRTVIMQIATDISVRKEAEETSRQQQEKLQFTSRLVTLGELASSLAHELNQPLAAISNYNMGCVSRIKNQTISLEELLPILEKVTTQAQRAGDVIHRIREFVKQQKPDRKPCQVSQIVNDGIEFSKLQAKNHGAEIKVELPDQDPAVLADSVLIEQVLINLIKNGIEAMQKRPADERRIKIVVSQTGQMALVEVHDQGEGVPQAILDRLFESFFTTKSEGMGMGLNICRTIIEYHQGRLWVEVGKPRGSIFKFTLPLITPMVQESNNHPA